MTAGRHNLTRRAVLGVALLAPHVVDRSAAASRSGANRERWDHALAALHRAEAAKHTYRIHLMAPADHAYEAVRARWPRDFQFEANPAAQATLRAAFENHSLVEERFNDHESARLCAIHRLLCVPAPDLGALAAKLALAIDSEVWELGQGEQCLARIRTDAQQLAQAGESPRSRSVATAQRLASDKS